MRGEKLRLTLLLLLLYIISIKYKKAEIMALINFKNKINAINFAYVAKFGL